MSRNNLVFYLSPETNAPEIQLFPQEIYLLGRSPHCNILLSDQAVSREHAKLSFSGETFVLEDLKSTNGVKVNGIPVSDSRLETMDIITLGRISFTYKIKEILPDGKKTLTPDDTKILDKDLDQIINQMESSPIKDKLLAFQNTFNQKKKDLIGLAYGDELTGLFNRRYFDRELETEIRRAVRYSRPLTLIMVDIDHFKKFNDTYGHQKGDSVLRTVGTILKENSRSSDIVCRYGGEEIAILLPEQDREQGVLTAEKLRTILAGVAKEIEDVEITASFGVGTTGENVKTGEELISVSDAALYRAKKSGRNCTAF